jgi:lipoprotein-anchoring transpeptidase ErfK/SrfK
VGRRAPVSHAAVPFARTFAPACATIVALAVAPATAAEPAPPTPATAWTAAFPRAVAARAAPRPGARVVDRVERRTAYWRRPQRLLVLSGVRRDATGAGWVRVRLTGRPNGAGGWVPVRAVRLSTTALRVRVRLGARRVDVLRGGRRVASLRAAVGTAATPTPTGLFAVQDPVPSSASQRSYLGPYIITLTAYSPVLTSFMGGNGLVAIHGTPATGLLGQAVSNGCVRITDEDVTRLYRMVLPGTPIEIVP